MIYLVALSGFAVLYGLAYLSLKGGYKKSPILWYMLIVVIGGASFFAFRNVGPSPDDENYVEYGLYAEGFFENLTFSDPVIFLLNEPGWVLFNYTISSIFGELWYFPVLVFLSFSLISFSSYNISRRPLLTIIVIILFAPLAKNWYIHLRQGFAISLFYFGLSLNSKKRYLFIFISPFIHTSIFINIGTQFYDYFSTRMGLSRVVRLVLFFLIAAAFAWLLEDLLKAIGYVVARRDYEDVGNLANPKVYLAYAALSYGYFMSTDDNEYMMNQFLYGLLLYITMGFSVPYAARVFENYLPFAALSITDAEYAKNYYYYGMVILGISAVIYLLAEHPFVQFDFSPFEFTPQNAKEVG